MKELEVLLNQRWVLKSENKELYYQLRDAIGDIRKYASDKLGCQVTENAFQRRVCVSLYFAYVSGRKRHAGTIYFIAAYRVHFCKYAGRVHRLDRIYKPEAAD